MGHLVFDPHTLASSLAWTALSFISVAGSPRNAPLRPAPLQLRRHILPVGGAGGRREKYTGLAWVPKTSAVGAQNAELLPDAGEGSDSRERDSDSASGDGCRAPAATAGTCLCREDWPGGWL